MPWPRLKEDLGSGIKDRLECPEQLSEEVSLHRERSVERDLVRIEANAQPGERCA
jgi:hypothetical protein